MHDRSEDAPFQKRQASGDEFVKIVIAGAGEVGFHIAQKLSEENQDVFLIDRDPEKIKRITEDLDVQAILGSGTSFLSGQTNILQAGISYI